jgi:iron(III) transport system substrate-binding protein
MGKFKVLSVLVLFSLLLASCATPTAVAPQEVVKETVVVKQTQEVQVEVVVTATAAPPTAVPEKPMTAAEQWAKDNGVGPYQPATEDWAAIEAAAKKEGSVVVYANSSKFEKLLDKWNELYPDIKLDGGDTDGITTKMQAEQEAGNVVGDVWFNSDGHILYGQFLPNEWIWAYLPPGVTEAADVSPERPIAVQRHSVDVWGYNQEIHPEGCPLTNWWQLVDPALKGKVFIENPLSDPSTNAKFTLIVEHADEMAAAYQEFYGKDWTTDPDAAPDAFGVAPENAGYLFLRKLFRNAPVLEPGGDEVDTAFASLGMDKTVEPGYGLTGWDSYSGTEDGELAMAPCLTIKPVIGIFKSNYVAIANKAPHPNAAKLFIKFILTQDGFKPWNKTGTYPAADGLEAWDGAPAVKDIKVWASDDKFAWSNNSKVRDFIATELFYVP